MVSRMRTGYPHGLNKGLGSKFVLAPDYDKKVPESEKEGSRVRKEGSQVREDSRVRQEIPKEGIYSYF